MANKPVLGYWSIRGLGQPIRFLLAYLEVDYEDKLYHDDGIRTAWLVEKETLKSKVAFPNLPYWIDDSITLTESRAILRHLCRTHKPDMLGKSSEMQALVDMVDSFIYDFWDNGLVKVCYQYTEELQKQYKETEPTKLGYLSNFLNGKQWVGGDDLTYVDFFVYEVLYHLVLYDDKCLEKFFDLQAYMKRFESLPAIKKYAESPHYLKKPIFSARSVIKI